MTTHLIRKLVGTIENQFAMRLLNGSLQNPRAPVD